MSRAGRLLWGAALLAGLQLGVAVDSTWGQNKSAPDAYVGNQMCVRCHSELHEVLVGTHHEGDPLAAPARDSCQSCHGPGRSHVQNPEDPARSAPLLAAVRSGVCEECHGEMPISPSHTVASVPCVACHVYHPAKNEISGMAKQSRCIDCHGSSQSFDDLHAYDMEGLQKGTIRCGSCHRTNHED